MDATPAQAVSPAMHEASRNRRLWIAFAIGSVLPIVAVLLKPQDHAFYMFFPAVPPAIAERARLMLANALLVASSVVAGLAAAMLFVRGVRSKRGRNLLPILLVVLNPFLQPVFFERLDTYMNDLWWHRASAASLIGKSTDEVRRALGPPTRIHSSDDGIEWNYKPLRFYWMGSKGQVFFRNERVSSLDANDD
jgi:hypothetical protein